MTLVMKVYKQGAEVLLAAADADLVGRTFRENGLRIDVKAGFYGVAEEDAADAQQLVQQLRACTIANLVGEAVVAVAVEHGFVKPGNVLTIGGVPHAQIAVLH